MSATAFLLRAAKPYISWMIFVVTCTALAAAATLMMPWIIRDLLANLSASDGPRPVLLASGLMLGALLLRGLCQFLSNWLAHHVAWHVCHDVRTHLYARVQRLSLRHVHDRNTADLHVRITKDTENLEPVIADLFSEFVVNVITFFGVAAIIFALDARVALLAMLPVPILFWIINLLGRNVYRLFGVEMDLGDRLHRTLLGNLNGLKEIQLFDQQDREAIRVRQQSSEFTDAQVRTRRLNATFEPAVLILSGGGSIGAVLVGGRAVLEGHLSSADLVAILMYLAIFYQPITLVAQVNEYLQRANTSIYRIQELLDLPEDMPEGTIEHRPSTAPPSLEFRGVSFGYDADHITLRNMNFAVPAGTTVGIVGPTGAGKSTLSSLVARLYDPTEGQVLIDGFDLRDFRLAALRRSMSIVSQDVFLFDGTVLANLLFAREDACRDDVLRATCLAQAHDFITALPQGYETQVGERGVKLSGGQKQRLALARALLKNASLLILDEATSAVDTQTESEIQHALHYAARGRTVLVIAHRLSTIRNADIILVLQNGEIVERGKHEQLLHLGGLYRTLYDAQAGSNSQRLKILT